MRSSLLIIGRSSSNLLSHFRINNGSAMTRRLCTKSSHDDNTKEDTTAHSTSSGLPPEVPSTCCASGCASCVWLDYAEEVIKYYEGRSESLSCDQLLQDVEKNIQDPMIKTFVKMEIRNKFR
eukprot:TRINITY_DN10609_c0_g1_i18.p1 TRINITY_DN10609_c0_g1~~TRINITY_DN10609_c0_g1_i18.p1  ORF type:complete len:122 (-),score=11.21 TRINITY_DN10609_c0_g1_i18:112-477(-)